jgi:cell division protein FtsB
MNFITLILLGLLGVTQYQLWFGSGSLKEVWDLQERIVAQSAENSALAERNLALAAEVKDLKEGLEAIEERARSELGMIHKDEIFYQVIDSEPAADTP